MRPSRFLASWDLGVAIAVAVLGAAATQILPSGSAARVVLALSALFLVPGYLLVQASLRDLPDARRRGRDLLLSLGVSVPVIGLFALLSALGPGRFGTGGFTLGLLVGCLGLACIAFARRTPRRTLGLVPPPVAMTQPALTLE